MKKSMKGIVLSMDGPPCSYCTCGRLCSPMNVDHVLPQSYLRNHIEDTRTLNVAINDLHNLYRVCERKNKEKGSTLLSDRIAGDEFSGLKARSYLYMNWKYQLQMDPYLLSDLKSFSLMHAPFLFEIRRSKTISYYNGQSNPFIDYFPLTISERF